MPSQRVVALSLDEETLEIWKALPNGERSERVREALRTASIVAQRDKHIEALRGLADRLRKERDDLKLFMPFTIEKGDKLIVPDGGE